ncbi:putative cullin repeat-like-containing domain, exocyst complex component Exo84 [Medicago truncatula]|uniref:Putative cullin repeat-like-containing domain, exocyst complex component Exo84 n=1 Tax=Medicago truncatula TaxID=3880 RepID=A0A396HIH5_MEDTR|nr:putative cullin repeat-like-containing domain, exocyst complex component Exo84 [Medicago truncatula]
MSMDQLPFVTPRGSVSSSIGSVAELEANPNLTLSDKLRVFKSSSFDPNAYVSSKSRSMNEKEIRHLCAYLVDLKKASAEEMRKSVLANYSAFIRTSKEISDLEGELLSMRNLLSNQAALVHGLAEGCQLGSLVTGNEGSDIDAILKEKTDISNTEKWLIEYLETLDVLLAEKRVEESMAALEEGEKMTNEITQGKTLSPSLFQALQNAITEHRQKLADQLADTICQPSTRRAEIRSTALALKNLGDGPRAHTLLLKSYKEKLNRNIQSLESTTVSAYTASVSHLVFSTISQATSDSLTVFAGEEPAYTSELVTWAVIQAENFSLLLKKQILASIAASGGLRIALECVHVCLTHCHLLESSGMALSPVLLKHFRPFVEQALITNLKRIEQSSAALASADDWLLAYAPTTRTRKSNTGLPPVSSYSNLNSHQPKLSISAHKFNSMVQLFEDAGPLEILQLDGLALEGLHQVFNFYVNLLINAMPGSAVTENLESTGHKIVKIAETETQQIALLGNAILLADELLPRAVIKLSHSTKGDDDSLKRASDKQKPPEQRELKKRLQREVDRLRDIFCRQHALELIFTVDGEPLVNSQMYLGMEEKGERPEWFPSGIFQELFIRLTEVATIVSDVFVGRERFATILLMRLTETVILWLSDDQAFWDDIERTPLGPLGLQQLYLDMQFVMIFSSQGRYLSRHLHQAIKNIIGRAIDAVAATGLDPNSVLPEDEWFVEVSEIAMKMLTGKAAFDNVDEDAYSPTGSAHA